MRKHSLSLLSIAVFTLLTTNVSNAAMVYKCKNAQGKLLYQKTPCTEEAVSSWTPNTKVKLPIKEPKKKNTEVLVIPQGQGGHYFLNGEVNSHGLTFVVDTGATIVSLPRAFAASASLFCNDKAVIETANGQSNVCTSTITELKLGNFVFKNVTALIVPNLAQPLLGMNVLQGFNIEQKNEEMRLSEQDAKAP
ncbi:MAG: retroviral-like aspartic protease family protein [Methylococcaceae bacterium]|nr:retroviral-like aspartic protease family protein [Methylococcaceae bacterium]